MSLDIVEKSIYTKDALQVHEKIGLLPDLRFILKYNDKQFIQ